MISFKSSELERRGNSSQLVIVLHAYMSSRKKLSAVRRVVGECYPDADLFVPDLPASWMSMYQPAEIVAALLKHIDQLWADRPDGYDSIILVGHSLGALLARKLYVCACGELEDAPFEDELQGPEFATDRPRCWAKKVDRLILLAGMNRGWRVSHHLSLANAVIWSLGVVFGNFLIFLLGKTPLIMAIRKGSPFMTQLRIQWIHMRRAASEDRPGKALTIQLLGTIDDMVSPDDNIDLASGRDFVYLDIPFSGHANVIEMDDTTTVPAPSDLVASDTTTKGAARAAVFKAALLEDRSALDARAIIPSDLPPDRLKLDVTDVVFVIHGIRDAGYWTHKIARYVLRLAKRENHKISLATETSSYGYFPMLPFLFPARRRAKVDWLMDRYAEALARYPKAKFSFVGHSNGTYLLAKALSDYPACRFENVVLAGSVIRTGYDWQKAKERGQVSRVLNFVATADWVVAIFPRAVQMLRLQDLGSAGHDGFREQSAGSEVLSQVRYVRGGHGAALAEANWDAIARFILEGRCEGPPPRLQRERRRWWVVLPGLVAPLIWLALFAAAGAGAYGIWSLGLEEWQRTILLAAYGFAIWKVVTTV